MQPSHRQICQRLAVVIAMPLAPFWLLFAVINFHGLCPRIIPDRLSARMSARRWQASAWLLFRLSACSGRLASSAKR